MIINENADLKYFILIHHFIFNPLALAMVVISQMQAGAPQGMDVTFRGT